MAIPEWAAKLLTARWQKKRIQILQSDLWQCQGCGETEKQLEVHHIDYWPNREPDQYDGKMLQVLCRTCHELEKHRKTAEVNLFNAFRYRKWTIADIYALSAYLHRYPAFSDKIKLLIENHIKEDL